MLFWVALLPLWPITELSIVRPFAGLPVPRDVHIVGGVNAGDLFLESGHGITVWVKSLGLVAN